jgi:hypothetical protein
MFSNPLLVARPQSVVSKHRQEPNASAIPNQLHKDEKGLGF